ncbi:Shikimate dehydrogenase [Pelotomaculum schinkii]|uniref:Shikimate dehydrogenase (NADP(+)) n=1 Tax=Pelotomaculum schinkii TaxID=78350 RepID=A0A4Y7RCB4_9FIRM|nr:MULTISPECIES: shikimate dehydrogenase [Pelotomaculum]TEB06624.1 Shikimate dehydrogenase [Pelotomaculum schinkii]TEB17581.1 Shikimate dehydrogenase [Pelotomaculum sp. FP]
MAGGINGLTKVCGIFGDPVQHSLSPAMHNAAFAATGLDYIYVPFQVEKANLPDAIKALRALNLAGVNITIPHKETVLPHLDEISMEAGFIGAVNTVVNRQGHLRGENTDGRGFIKALSEQVGFNPKGKTALVLGAGGAARAVAVQLALSGPAKLVLANRSRPRAEGLAKLIAEKTGAAVAVAEWPAQGLQHSDSRMIANADLVVQATPVGMYPYTAETVFFPFERLKQGVVVCDLVYNPARTNFLNKAAHFGAVTVNGLGMLLYQGALAFELWTGITAPVEVMRDALMKALSTHS